MGGGVVQLKGKCQNPVVRGVGGVRNAKSYTAQDEKDPARCKTSLNFI